MNDIDDLRGLPHSKVFPCSFCDTKGDLGHEVIHIGTVQLVTEEHTDLYICTECYNTWFCD